MSSLVMVCILFTFGFFEFSDWLSNGTGFMEGLLVEHLHLRSTFLLNPFLAIYLMLPLTWSVEIKEQFRDNCLSRFPILLNSWVYRLAPWLLGLCLAFLAHQLRKILIVLNANQPFVPSQHASIFISVIGICFLIQLVLINLPRLKVLDEKILGKDDMGLYGLKPGQFIIQYVLGESQGYKKLTGPGRYYKEKSALWYVFSEGNTDLEEAFAATEFGHLQVQWSLWAVVGDFNDIRSEDIQLSQIESASQFYTSIRREFVYEFRRKFTEQSLYQDLDQLLTYFFRGEKGTSVAYTLEESLEQMMEARIIHLAIDRLQDELITTTSIETPIHGKLYTLYAKLDQVALKPSLADSLAQFEQRLATLSTVWYERVRYDREFGLEFAKTVSEAMERVQGLLPRSMQNDIFKAFTDRIKAEFGDLVPEDLQNLKDCMAAYDLEEGTDAHSHGKSRDKGKTDSNR